MTADPRDDASLSEHDSLFQRGYYGRQYSARWWRNRGSRPLLFRSLLRTIRRRVGSGRLLDVGCGEGAWLSYAATRFEAFGVDISAEGVEAAQERTGLSTIVCASATALPHADSAFDVVTALDVVEHIEDPALLLAEARRVLVPGGLLVLSTPNPSSLGSRLKGRDSFIYRDPTHVSVLPAAEWRELVTTSGFVVDREGTDTLWDVPYVRRVPRVLQWLVFVGLSQAAWALAPMFRWSLGENYWCIAHRP